MTDALSPARITEAPLASDKDVPHELPFLAFTIGDAEYALPLASVAEIQRMLPFTHVPRAPKSIRGIVSLRGVITTVFDMSERLSGGALRGATRIVLVRLPEETVGLLVDGVTRVLQLSHGEIEPTGNWSADASPHVVGVSRPNPDDSAHVVQVLDPIALWEGLQ